MKISLSAHASSSESRQKDVLLPLVPLKEPPKSETMQVTHTLRSNPTDPDSPKYKMTCTILQGGEDVRSLLKWRFTMNKVLHGLNVTDQDPAIAIVETLLSGTPLTLFSDGLEKAKGIYKTERIRAATTGQEKAAERAKPLTHDDFKRFENIDLANKHMIERLIPRNTLARVKRYLRRECRKPRDMKVRNYLQHLLRMNLEELPNLPPFQATQSLGGDEMLDIVLYGTPKSWQKEMDRQGFDPMDNTLNAVVDFMERIEATDDFDVNSEEVKSSKKSSKKKEQRSTEKKTQW